MKESTGRLLAEFVNREAEITDFRAILEAAGRSIFVVSGEGGVGKSYLQSKMIHEVASRRLAKAEIDVTEVRHNDYLSIMRKIRDDIGIEHFNPFTDLVNFFTVPQYDLRVSLDQTSVSVLDGASLQDVKAGDIAGVIIKDVMLVAPRSDRAIPDNERMARLTDAFLACLAASARDRVIVVFFDAVEKLNSQTENWLWNEILEATRRDDMCNIRFVLCGRTIRSLSRNWRDVVVVRELKPLSLDYVIQYLMRRGVVNDSVTIIAETLLAVTQGNLLGLANAVDSLPQHFLETRRQA